MRERSLETEAAEYLCTPAAIRERCGRLLALAVEGKLENFGVDRTKLAEVAEYVVEVTRENYPDLKIPVHSRWGHFEVGGVARKAELDGLTRDLDVRERARVQFDLVITSVLLDAGSGPTWKYSEGPTEYSRSEGLAVASFRMFVEGRFSSDPKKPLQADAEGLANLTKEQLARAFQVTESNPLAGMDGRLALLQGLGRAVPRPGVLFDRIATKAIDGKVRAEQVLDVVLTSLGTIWPGRIELAGRNLGDVWQHSALAGEKGGQAAFPTEKQPVPISEVADRLVPFHKLSQWLTYSLLEPLAEGGIEVTDLDALTGLPEYRNGGLLVDLGLLVAKNPKLLTEAHLPGSEPIVEWRALTVALLDEIAVEVRKRLGLDAKQLPLAAVLQGGTWSAGRKIAAAKRPGGGPPIRIESDGTVF